MTNHQKTRRVILLFPLFFASLLLGLLIFSVSPSRADQLRIHKNVLCNHPPNRNGLPSALTAINVSLK